MPEGPEVRITSEGLNYHLKNLQINEIKITPASRYYKNELKNHNKLIDLYPLTVIHVFPKGKKIIFDCFDKNMNKVVLISALAMEGSWKIYTGKHAGIELITPTKTLYFHDSRHFGTFYICFNQEEIDDVLKSVGPDLLNENVAFDDYSKVISEKRIEHKEICWFMMEQKFFSGVGNYILAEVLYECKILPTRLLKDLSSEDKYNLWFYSRKILKDSYQYGGVTISTYFGMNGERGIFRVKVYGQKYDPYGNPVETGVFSNNRTSHFVPNIQT